MLLKQNSSPLTDCLSVCLIVDFWLSGGEKVLLSFKQESPADHVELSEVLKSLGIEGAPAEGAATGETKPPGVTCDGDVCKRT